MQILSQKKNEPIAQIQDNYNLQQQYIEKRCSKYKPLTLDYIDKYIPDQSYLLVKQKITKEYPDFQIQDLDCALCMTVFEDDDNCKMTYCFHAYHSHCLKFWLLKKEQCPICKKSQQLRKIRQQFNETRSIGFEDYIESDDDTDQEIEYSFDLENQQDEDDNCDILDTSNNSIEKQYNNNDINDNNQYDNNKYKYDNKIKKNNNNDENQKDTNNKDVNYEDTNNNQIINIQLNDEALQENKIKTNVKTQNLKIPLKTQKHYQQHIDEDENEIDLKQFQLQNQKKDNKIQNKENKFPNLNNKNNNKRNSTIKEIKYYNINSFFKYKQNITKKYSSQNEIKNSKYITQKTNTFTDFSNKAKKYEDSSPSPSDNDITPYKRKINRQQTRSSISEHLLLQFEEDNQQRVKYQRNSKNKGKLSILSNYNNHYNNSSQINILSRTDINSKSDLGSIIQIDNDSTIINTKRGSDASQIIQDKKNSLQLNSTSLNYIN